MILLFVFDVKVMKVFLVFNLLIKYYGGYGYVFGGVVMDMGNFDWMLFSNIKLVYQVVDECMWGII